MADYLMGYLDDALSGEDELGMYLGDEMGARRGRNALIARRQLASRALARRAVPTLPGVPPAGARRLPLGFPTVTFNAASGTQLTATTQPQIPVVGQRLVITVSRTGATSTGAVTLADIKIGQRSQLASANPIPAEAFAPNAFGVALDLDPAQPGINVVLIFNIAAAPGGTDNVVVASALINPSIG